MIEKIKKPKNAEKIAKAKATAVEPIKVKTPPELLCYEIEATIPTGPYANIKPKISVLADSLEDAEGYVIPHINKLFAEFLNRSERPVVTCVSGGVPCPAPGMTVTATSQVSANYARARQAIDSCKSKEAMELIKGQVEKSVKLNDLEKKELLAYIGTK